MAPRGDEVTVNIRQYAGSTGFSDDFHRVRQFLVRINQGELATPGFLWGRWEWMFSLPYLDATALSQIGIWEDDGLIVAVVTYETDTGFACLLTDAAHAWLYADLLAWARTNLSRTGVIRILVNDTDHQLEQVVAAHGLTRTPDREPNAALDLTADLSYRLPEGYRIASLADGCDLHRLNRVLHRGFHNPGQPLTTPAAIQERRISVSGPHLDRALNMVAIAPDGEYAAYCGVWLEPTTDYALVEPVCTDPDHRLLGLGRAVVLEAARRCGLRGAKVAYVGSDQLFYYAIGFTPDTCGTWWELPDPKLRNP